MDFDIRQVFAVGFVFHFEVFCSDVSDFIPVGDYVDFQLVIFVGELLVGYVYGDAAEALFKNLVMQSAGIYSDTRFALRVGKCAEYDSRNVGENDPTKGIGETDIYFADSESELTVFIGF